MRPTGGPASMISRPRRPDSMGIDKAEFLGGGNNRRVYGEGVPVARSDAESHRGGAMPALRDRVARTRPTGAYGHAVRKNHHAFPKKPPSVKSQVGKIASRQQQPGGRWW